MNKKRYSSIFIFYSLAIDESLMLTKKHKCSSFKFYIENKILERPFFMSYFYLEGSRPHMAT